MQSFPASSSFSSFSFLDKITELEEKHLDFAGKSST